jgi:multidrug efflux system outer membrane protein
VHHFSSFCFLPAVSGSGSSARAFLRGVCSLAMVGVLAACSVKPLESDEPEQPALAQLFESEPALLGGKSSSAPEAASQNPNWWESFNDARLSRLVEHGLGNNLDLTSAWARLQQSRAVAVQAASGKTPELTANVGRERSWTQDTATNSWQAGLSASYELDLWGRVAATAAKGEWDAMATQAAARVVANTVAGEIANNWFGWLAQQSHIESLLEQQATQEALVRSTASRYRRGLVTISQLWQQQQSEQVLAAEMADARAAEAQYRQQLAIWTAAPSWMSDGIPDLIASDGDATAEGEAPQPFDHLTFGPIPGIDLGMLRRRPDVQQAWFELQASQADLAAAVASRYPRLSLTASYSTEDASLSDLFDNWAANLLANLAVPLIDGGSRKADQLQSQAAREAALADYQQVLLEATQEVFQSLNEEQRASEEVSRISNQLALVVKSERYAHSRYRRGLVTYPEYLDAQQSRMQLERQLTAVTLQRYLARIQLFRTISHGQFSQPSDQSENSAALINASQTSYSK